MTLYVSKVLSVKLKKLYIIWENPDILRETAKELHMLVRVWVKFLHLSSSLVPITLLANNFQGESKFLSLMRETKHYLGVGDNDTKCTEGVIKKLFIHILFTESGC